MYAELLGYDTAFDADSMYRYNPEATGAISAIRQAFEEAQISPEDVDYISACANSTKGCDAMENTAINAVFGARAQSIPVNAVKSLLGESFSAGGALQIAMTVGVLAEGKVLTTMNTELALVDGFGPTGVSSALVIGQEQ